MEIWPTWIFPSLSLVILMTVTRLSGKVVREHESAPYFLESLGSPVPAGVITENLTLNVFCTSWRSVWAPILGTMTMKAMRSIVLNFWSQTGWSRGRMSQQSDHLHINSLEPQFSPVENEEITFIHSLVIKHVWHIYYSGLCMSGTCQNTN